jgi:DNA-binding transcriptional LysR family regulator
VHGRLRFGGADACVAAARRSLGVTRTPAFAAADDLRGGRLVPLLCAYEPQLIHVHAVYPHARHLAAKVRAFVDFLAQRYAGEPEWHQGWGATHTAN